MAQAHFSSRFGLARFLSVIALDPERTNQFLESPEHAVRGAGLDPQEQALMLSKDVLALYKHMQFKYQVIRPSPDEQPGDG